MLINNVSGLEEALVKPEVILCRRCGSCIEDPLDADTASMRHSIVAADESGKVIIKSHYEISAKMDARIDHLDNLIERLRLQRAAVSRERNSYTPVTARLPVEIMTEIFLFAFALSCPQLTADSDVEHWQEPQIDTLRTQSTVFPLLLGKVCSSWRRIAWGLSELWSSFHCRVVKKSVSAQAALLNEWLDRSEPRLLSIRISMDDEDSWSGSSADTPTQIIDALIPHCRRWHRMTLILPERWYDKLVSVKGKLYNLLTLSIRPPGYIFVLKSVDAFSNAPKLQRLNSSHYYLHHLDFPWAQLTNASLETASADEALELIRRCPSLTSCHFEDLNVMESNFTPDIVVHPNMESLYISLDASTILSPFLAYLIIPSLCDLTLSLPENHPNPIPIIEIFIERSECPLKKVKIMGPSLDEHDIVNFLAYNTSMKDFTNK